MTTAQRSLTLEKQIIDLRGKLKLLDQIETLKQWQTANNYEGVIAQVVAGRQPVVQYQWSIDKGLSSGISKNQPVVTAGGTGRPRHQYMAIFGTDPVADR